VWAPEPVWAGLTTLISCPLQFKNSCEIQDLITPSLLSSMFWYIVL